MSFRAECQDCGEHMTMTEAQTHRCGDRLTATEEARVRAAINISEEQEARKEEHVFTSGAKRSEVKPFYDQLTSDFIRRVALRCTGTPKGDPPMVRNGFEYAGGSRGYGRRNWRQGLPMEDTFNHLIEHLFQWKATIETGIKPVDDELAASGWGIQALMFFEDEYARQHRARISMDRFGPAAKNPYEPKDRLIDFGGPHQSEKSNAE